MGEALITRRGGGEKVTIDGVNVKDKLDLITIRTSNMSISTLPYSKFDGTSVSHNGELHSMGKGTEHYKWDSTAWTQVSTIPFGAEYATAVVFNDEIHLMSGTNHYKWDGASWTQVSTLPVSLGISGGKAVVLNDELYFAVCVNYKATLYKWDGIAWTLLTSASANYVSDVSAAVLNDKIYVTFNASGAVNETQFHEFNGTQLVRAASGGHTSLESNCVVTFDGAIHLIGSSSSDYYTLHDKWDGETFTRLKSLPLEYSAGNAVVHNGYINLVGGYNSRTAHYALDVDDYRKVI